MNERPDTPYARPRAECTPTTPVTPAEGDASSSGRSGLAAPSFFRSMLAPTWRANLALLLSTASPLAAMARDARTVEARAEGRERLAVPAPEGNPSPQPSHL
jgi:hypothetical protein